MEDYNEVINKLAYFFETLSDITAVYPIMKANPGISPEEVRERMPAEHQRQWENLDAVVEGACKEFSVEHDALMADIGMTIIENRLAAQHGLN